MEFEHFDTLRYTEIVTTGFLHDITSRLNFLQFNGLRPLKLEYKRLIDGVKKAKDLFVSKDYLSY